MSDYCCRIERAANGYEVSLTDPKIAKENRSSKGGWRDPNIKYVFEDIGDVLAFLKTNLDKALMKDEYSSTFDAASAAKDD